MARRTRSRRRATPAPAAVLLRPTTRQTTTSRPGATSPLSPTRSLSPLPPIVIPPLLAGSAPARPEHDRRRYHPDAPYQPAPATRTDARRLVVAGPAYQALRFADPSRVLVCARRRTRAQVLHALGVAGQRGRKRRPRRTLHSAISC